MNYAHINALTKMLTGGDRMLSEYVVPGSKIEIRPINQEDLGEELLIKKKVYQSQVSDILSEDRLEILMPM